jgi:hypothetical protein
VSGLRHPVELWKVSAIFMTIFSITMVAQEHLHTRDV